MDKIEVHVEVKPQEEKYIFLHSNWLTLRAKDGPELVVIRSEMGPHVGFMMDGKTTMILDISDIAKQVYEAMTGEGGR